ncbi:MAG: hypothetical protein ACMUIM_02880 [bacterium]
MRKPNHYTAPSVNWNPPLLVQKKAGYTVSSLMKQKRLSSVSSFSELEGIK